MKHFYRDDSKILLSFHSFCKSILMLIFDQIIIYSQEFCIIPQVFSYYDGVTFCALSWLVPFWKVENMWRIKWIKIWLFLIFWLTKLVALFSKIPNATWLRNIPFGSATPWNLYNGHPSGSILCACKFSNLFFSVSRNLRKMSYRCNCTTSTQKIRICHHRPSTNIYVIFDTI